MGYGGVPYGIGKSREAVDISSGDYVPDMKTCTHITATDGTYIKVDFVDGNGETVTGVLVPLGTERRLPLNNIVKVYQSGHDTTANIALWT